MIAAILVSGTIVIMTKIGQKKTKKNAINDDVKTILASKDLTIKTLREELNRQLGRANRYKQIVDQAEGLENEEQPSITMDQIKAFAKTKGIKPEILDVPMVKEYVEEFVKGKSIEELTSTIELVQKFIPKDLKLGEQNQGTEQQAANRIDYA